MSEYNDLSWGGYVNFDNEMDLGMDLGMDLLVSPSREQTSPDAAIPENDGAETEPDLGPWNAGPFQQTIPNDAVPGHDGGEVETAGFDLELWGAFQQTIPDVAAPVDNGGSIDPAVLDLRRMGNLQQDADLPVVNFQGGEVAAAGVYPQNMNGFEPNVDAPLPNDYGVDTATVGVYPQSTNGPEPDLNPALPDDFGLDFAAAGAYPEFANGPEPNANLALPAYNAGQIAPAGSDPYYADPAQPTDLLPGMYNALGDVDWNAVPNDNLGTAVNPFDLTRPSPPPDYLHAGPGNLTAEPPPAPTQPPPPPPQGFQPTNNNAPGKLIFRLTGPCPKIPYSASDDAVVDVWLEKHYPEFLPPWAQETGELRAGWMLQDMWARAQAIRSIHNAQQLPAYLALHSPQRKERMVPHGPLAAFWAEVHRRVEKSRSQVKQRALKKQSKASKP